VTKTHSSNMTAAATRPSEDDFSSTSPLKKMSRTDENSVDNGDTEGIHLEPGIDCMDAIWKELNEPTNSPQPQYDEVKTSSTESTPQPLIPDANNIPMKDSSLPPWPSTPPSRDETRRGKSPNRPLYLPSSSSGYFPSVESESGNDELGPASRAANAALSDSSNEILAPEHNLLGVPKDNRGDRTVDYSRQDTLHCSNQSGLNELGNEISSSNNITSTLRSNDPTPTKGFMYPSTTSFPDASKISIKIESPMLNAFTPNTLFGNLLTYLSRKFVPTHQLHTHGGSALAGFFALLLVTCANYMLGPMRDAAALAVGVSHIPALTLASTVLALGSSVPVGWLFEAPDPRRRRLWKRMGLTRGETQGTSLALFYRVFAFLLLSYALGFQLVEIMGKSSGNNDEEGRTKTKEEESIFALVGSVLIRLLAIIGIPVDRLFSNLEQIAGDMLGTQDLVSSSELYIFIETHKDESFPSLFMYSCTCLVNKFGKVIYIMFFLVVHLMKLHSLSLIWGVTTEAMEYEENAEKRRLAQEKEKVMHTTSAGGLVMTGSCHVMPSTDDKISIGPKIEQTTSHGECSKQSKSSIRLTRLSFVGFGGTLGGILGSVIASFTAHILHLSGLLIVAAIMLEISANLSIELGRIMQRHWEEQMKYQSCGDLASLANTSENDSGTSVDSSMKKSASLGSMKRVASGNLNNLNTATLARRASAQGSDGGGMTRAKSVGSMSVSGSKTSSIEKGKNGMNHVDQPMIDDNSFKQRLLRGVTTILRSRLLMAIFTYNALYASTSVLLSFQRAELVANRSSSRSSAVSNTAFLAKINTASSVAVFALQASGLGAYIANCCGQRGALALMPIIRLCGVILLGWWHLMSDGRPPDLILFLVIDEFTKVINFAIAKPVRENLWRGLSAEARYEAKPIVDTLANRWGGGSAAFLVSFINRIMDLIGFGVVKENGERSILGFPPVLLLCMVISAWWTMVSADVGNIRRKIDAELKKQQ